jgi:hypothetical protein
LTHIYSGFASHKRWKEFKKISFHYVFLQVEFTNLSRERALRYSSSIGLKQQKYSQFIPGDLIMAETNSETSYDAKLMNEEIEAGELEEPKANVESDYEHSKAYATSETDSENTTSARGSRTGQLQGEQKEFRKIAKDMRPDADE